MPLPGFDALYAQGDILEAACWAHARRKFFEIHQAQGSPIAAEALKRIAALYAIESTVRGKPPDIRLKRREQVKRILDEFHAWLLDTRHLLMNRFQAALYGTTTDTAIGRTAGEIMGADYGNQARAFDRRVLASGEQVAMMEHDFVDVRGETHDWYTIKLPLGGDGDDAEGIITVALDVTKLIRLERARINLGRYVPPSMADMLAESDEPMGPPGE